MSIGELLKILLAILLLGIITTLAIEDYREYQADKTYTPKANAQTYSIYTEAGIWRTMTQGSKWNVYYLPDGRKVIFNGTHSREQE